MKMTLLALRRVAIVLLATITLLEVAALAQPATLTIATDKPGTKINPGMWGIFFEDINLGADGGLYAELVKNRSFEFPKAMMGWGKVSSGEAAGELFIRTESPFNAVNPHYVRIASKGAGRLGISNEGFRGVGVQGGDSYDFSTQVRAVSGTPTVRVELVDTNGAVIASASLKNFTTNWVSRTAKLTANATEAKARLNVMVEGGGAVDLDMVSLFPKKTWKNRPGGLRADMVQKLADLKPGFLRFPGGCIVEGNYLTNRYQWKTTIGPIEERKLIVNRWNFEFKHRLTPDYYQTFGLGFFEYFQLCEDIGAEPLPILSCGLACQFNSGQQCTPAELDAYIQDAIDLIEFANGPMNSKWGAERSAMGHPEPFNLKMIGVGNENWDAPYLERYAKFHAVLKAKHPEIKLVSSAGPFPDDAHFKFAWPKLRELNADIVDEHCYAKPDWFFNNTHRYDDYDRKGPKVFFGEYAAQSDKVVSVENRNNLECAISEAACMTGLERNGDVVQMASYAPLFAHEEGWQWRPNLIWVDNLRIYGTPNYYVQKLFSNNRGDAVLPSKLDGVNNRRLYASTTRDEGRGEIIVKLVNGDDAPAQIKLNLSGEGRMTVLTGANRADENTFTEPKKVSPKDSAISLSKETPITLPANSLVVLRVSAKK